MSNKYTLAIVILILVIAGGILAYSKKNNPTPSISPTISASPSSSPVSSFTPTPTPEPSVTPMPSVDVSDWKTYRNDKYGFELKYPADWFIKSDSATNVIIVNNRYKNTEGEFPYISISVYGNTKNLSLRNWFYANQSQFFGDIKPKEGSDYKLNNTAVGSYNAIEFSYSRIIKNTLVDFNSNIVSISAINAIENYDQILSTFKSTEK